MSKYIIIFTGALSSGGAEKQSVLLAKSLKDDYIPIVISYYNTEKLKRVTSILENNQICYHILEGSILTKIKHLFLLIKEYKPYVIINYLPSNNFIGGILGRLLKVPLIFGNVRSSRQPIFKYLILLFSDKILNTLTIYNSLSGYDYFTSRGFSRKKSIVIHNCLYPIPELHNKVKLDEKIVKILIVSRFEVYKDYPTAIKAFKKLILLAGKKYILKLIIVGNGPLKAHVEQLINDFCISDVVDIVVNPENIEGFYRNADVFLQTSLFEGFSNSIMEAMSYSLPVIATNVGDNNVLIKSGVNGYLADIKDIDEIANYLYYLVSNPDIRIEMGQISYNIIKQEYTENGLKNKYLNILS